MNGVSGEGETRREGEGEVTTTKFAGEQAVARTLAAGVAAIAGVVAVSLGGSAAYGLADAASDLDLHVYYRGALASTEHRLAQLAHIADTGSVTSVTTWGLEDWLRLDGQHAELIYIDLDELQATAARAYHPGLIDEAFVTAQFAYLAEGRVLHDSTGEITALRKGLRANYPEATRAALLRDNPIRLHAYLKAIRTAQTRGDLLYVQHRRYSVQMVFFNLLFALNRRYHPGEKRLAIHGERCPIRPVSLADRWAISTQLPADAAALPEQLETLVNDLLALVENHQ